MFFPKYTYKGDKQHIFLKSTLFLKYITKWVILRQFIKETIKLLSKYYKYLENIQKNHAIQLAHKEYIN